MKNKNLEINIAHFYPKLLNLYGDFGNVVTLQKILGHSTLAVTMDLYVHVTDEHIFEEIEKMNVTI